MSDEHEYTGIECPRCNEKTGVVDTCPYDEDVYNNPESECECCPSCRYECAMDI